MSKTAILEFDGNKYEFPVIVGSENEAAIWLEKAASNGDAYARHEVAEKYKLV